MIHEDDEMLRITPTSKKVLIVACKEREMKGGLILPDKKQPFYHVIALADDCEMVKMGDKVVVDFATRGIYRTDDYIIVDESAIVAIKDPN